MRRIHDLNDDEVLALTDTQVDRFVDIECAVAGVPLLPDYPGLKPVLESPPTDQVLYSVVGVSDYFEDKATADALAAALVGARRLDTTMKGGIRVASAVPSYRAEDLGAIRTIEVVSMAAYDMHREAIESNAQTTRTWEAAKREYDAALSDRNQAAEDVYARVAEARDTLAMVQRLERALAEYTALAEGNGEMALRFLHNAYPEAADFEQFGPVPTAEEAADEE
jgi:hypothetical protein